MLETKLINNGVAIEIKNIDIANLKYNDGKKILDILHKNLIVVIKAQNTNPWHYTSFIESLGEINNYSQMLFHTNGDEALYPASLTKEWKYNKHLYPVQRVTGMKKNKKHTGIFGSGILDWHPDLNGLNRADGVSLQCWAECLNASTSFLNTNLAYNELDANLYDEINNLYCEYEYSPQVWAAGSPKEHLDIMIRKGCGKYKMWLIQKNIAGVKGIYFHINNKCKIITENDTLYERLRKHLFQDKYIYKHWWKQGDIILSDALLTLHKRDQNDPSILSKRVLNRIAFNISNTNGFVEKQNQI